MSYFDNKRCNWAISILAFSNIALITFLLLRPGGPPHPQYRLADRMRKELQLTEEQSQKFKALQEAHFQETRPIHEQMYSAKHKMIQAIARDQPDGPRAREYAALANRQSLTLDSMLIEHVQRLVEVCTPEQRQRLGDIFSHALPGPPGPPIGGDSR